MKRRTFVGLGLAAAALAGGTVSAAVFQRAMATANAMCDPGRSSLAATRFGAIEYAEAGSGPPVLMLHGTGGGFDQGLLFARRLTATGYRVVAPSRFGYLRTPAPPDPSSANQADQLADLLDALGLDRVAVAGGSAGALPALQFAIRHPQRCAALIPIVPAAYAPNRPPARPWGRVQTAIAEAVLRSDFLFWAGIVSARNTMIETLLATDPALLDTASPDERARAETILRGILPVSKRAEGLLIDARLAGNPAPMALSGITAPTLAISLEDDRFLTADAARHIAAEVPGARLIIYDNGGHIWVGRDSELFGAVAAFLNDIGYA